MLDDPRKAKTLDEAARNPDGTYNGLRAMSWLSGLPLEEVTKIARETQARIISDRAGGPTSDV